MADDNGTGCGCGCLGCSLAIFFLAAAFVLVWWAAHGFPGIGG